MYTYIKYISGQYLVYRKHTFCLRTVYNADHRSLAEITKLPKTESCWPVSTIMNTVDFLIWRGQQSHDAEIEVKEWITQEITKS